MTQTLQRYQSWDYAWVDLQARYTNMSLKFAVYQLFLLQEILIHFLEEKE